MMLSALSQLQINGFYHGNLIPAMIFAFPNNVYKIAEHGLISSASVYQEALFKDNDDHTQQLYLSPELL